MHWMPITGRVVLGEGAADWSRLQSLFGLMRAHGAGEAWPGPCRPLGTLAVAAALLCCGAAAPPTSSKPPALAVGTLLATPYVYMYDLVVLAVAVAFLVRFALARGFTASEVIGLPGAGALILIYPYQDPSRPRRGADRPGARRGKKRQRGKRRVRNRASSIVV